MQLKLLFFPKCPLLVVFIAPQRPWRPKLGNNFPRMSLVLPLCFLYIGDVSPWKIIFRCFSPKKRERKCPLHVAFIVPYGWRMSSYLKMKCSSRLVDADPFVHLKIICKFPRWWRLNYLSPEVRKTISMLFPKYPYFFERNYNKFISLIPILVKIVKSDLIPYVYRDVDRMNF